MFYIMKYTTIFEFACFDLSLIAMMCMFLTLNHDLIAHLNVKDDAQQILLGIFVGSIVLPRFHSKWK